MHLQSLELLRLTVQEEVHLQENTLFDLYLGVKVIRNIAQHPLHHVIYASAKFEVLCPTVSEKIQLQET